MKNYKIKKAKKAISTVAEAEKLSVEEILSEMKAAIAEGLSSTDPAVQERWQNIPCKGDSPEPEEVIAWVAEAVKEKMRI